MSLVPPTVADLSTFTGREINSFGNYAQEALTQASLLLFLSTNLSEYPEDPQLAMLARYGIMDMADKIYLSQPYVEAAASPFQSESIGSYSYSKMNQAVKKGNNTGVTWFDLAVSRLKSGGAIIAQSGSIEGMEWDGLERTPDGRTKIAGASSGTHDIYRNAWDIDTFEDVVHNHPIL